jgi:hypothetical protein
MMLNIQPPPAQQDHVKELTIVVFGQEGPKSKGPMCITHVHKACTLGLVVKEEGVSNN